MWDGLQVASSCRLYLHKIKTSFIVGVEKCRLLEASTAASEIQMDPLLSSFRKVACIIQLHPLLF